MFMSCTMIDMPVLIFNIYIELYGIYLYHTYDRWGLPIPTPTATLLSPSCLWTRIFQPLPVAHLKDFACDASSAPILQMVESYLLVFSRFPLRNHDELKSCLAKIELTTSALLAGMQRCLLDHRVRYQQKVVHNLQYAVDNDQSMCRV